MRRFGAPPSWAIEAGFRPKLNNEESSRMSMSTGPSSCGALRALTLAAFSVFALASAPHASAQERVLDVDFNPMVFEDGALVSGTAGTTGAVYRFDTVRLVDGTTIRAFVELEEVTSTCDITLFDDDGSNLGRFQPRLEADGGEGYVDFLIRFVDQDDVTPVALENFAITGVDIDGTSSYQEFHEVGGFSSTSSTPPRSSPSAPETTGGSASTAGPPT